MRHRGIVLQASSALHVVPLSDESTAQPAPKEIVQGDGTETDFSFNNGSRFRRVST